MSLKTFHIFFIVVSILFSFGFSWWELTSFRTMGQSIDLAFTIISIITGIGLAFYCAWFIKKSHAMKAV
jgi:hypothetical protein